MPGEEESRGVAWSPVEGASPAVTIRGVAMIVAMGRLALSRPALVAEWIRGTTGRRWVAGATCTTAGNRHTRGEPGHRGEPRGSDSEGGSREERRRLRRAAGPLLPRIDDSGPSRYSRRDVDPLLDSRDSRSGPSRDGRGGGRSRSVSPNRGYERKRLPARSAKQEVSKRGEGDGKPEVDEIREGSGGSRGSSPRHAREKAPAAKTSRSSSQDEAPERPDQSPDTSMPEEGQEVKSGAADTYSDWSDDDDDEILIRGDQQGDFSKKEASSDTHTDAASQDKPEEAGDPNL
uniref:Putative eukaryotic translation initiation factor 3 subunit a n=1 Tax=Amblyomma cajennense TaxID=34607 RepID=A0A023FFR9_AMBCJ